MEFFWSVFFCIRTEYADLLCKSPYSAWKRKDTGLKNSKYGHFLHGAYERNWLIRELGFSRMVRLIFLILFRRFDPSFEQLRQARLKCEVSSAYFPQLQRNHSICIGEGDFTPANQTKKLFAVDFVNFYIFDFKILNVSEFRMFSSNLFHSIMKFQLSTLILGTLSTFQVLYWQLDCDIISKRYFGHWLSSILKMKHRFHTIIFVEGNPNVALETYRQKLRVLNCCFFLGKTDSVTKRF